MLAAALLGAAQAAWSVFQWRELLDLRRGGEVFCIGGGSGCADVWDSPLAAAVQAATAVPVAGWGVVWGGVAAGLALWAWRRRAGPAVAAVQLTALAGVLTVVGLAGSLLLAGSFCSTCAVTYGLVLAYAAVVFLGVERPAGSPWGPGLGLAAAATVAGYLAVLYPGLQTPPSTGATVATLDPTDDLSRWVQSLPQPVQQELSNALAMFATTRPARRDFARRRLLGPADAPVRITDFSDIRCSHCAQLHVVLERLRDSAPAGTVAFEARHFPLDGRCNPRLPQRADDPVRCAAARALLCIDDPEEAFEASGAMFEDPALDDQRVVEIAARHRSRAELEACMTSPETDAHLQGDIDRAGTFDIQGTPLVLVNDRRAFAYPPFLYAITLAEGRTDHPAFAALPRPRLLERRP
ncbi:MAG: thioredoxin domain-containing protein [Myxococcota bacterium]|nr:thioredoxin domain-containing protein [Myxococcota bacterium]